MSVAVPSPRAPWPGGAPPVYERRRPEDGALHRVVRENLATLLAAAEEGFAGVPLPPFVRAELGGYLGCGVLQRGFALVACGSCSERRLVAFSCKTRSFCPACLGRRMASTTLNLLDHVVPKVNLRQFVLTVPHALRARLGYDGALCAAVARIFVDTVLGWYRRRMTLEGAQDGQSGAVTVVQRVSADLKLDPHYHAVFLDGVFGMDGDERPVFRTLPRMSNTAVADLLAVVRARITRFLVRRAVVSGDETGTVLPDDVAAREPALAALAAAAVAGLPPAGPERRRKPVVVELPPSQGPRVVRPLCVEDAGWSLHANTRAGALDERGREALFKYILRPPIANEHVQITDEGLVRIVLKRPFRDGTTMVEMDGLSLCARLCAAVFPPRFHTVRYAGVLAPGSALRPLIVPAPPPRPPPAGRTAAPPTPHSLPPPPGNVRPGHRCRYIPWAELLRRSFAIDVLECPRCKGRMTFLALVTEQSSAARYLAHLGLPTEEPPCAPARAPPYWQSRVLRRLHGAPATAEG